MLHAIFRLRILVCRLRVVNTFYELFMPSAALALDSKRYMHVGLHSQVVTK